MDRHLSPHFTLAQATVTTHKDLAAVNSILTYDEEIKVTETLELLEQIIVICGHDVDLHSLFRCELLNKRVGSSEASQHRRGEAADISPRGPDTEASVRAMWNKLVEAAKAGRFKFGQLLLESQDKPREGRAHWIHVSLGIKYRDAARCGEYFEMHNGKRTTPLLRIKEAV